MVSAPSHSSSDFTATATTRAETDLIDNSARVPVLLLFGFGTAWLLFASVLSVICSWKLNAPEFLAACEWLTYGRLHPAQTNGFLYGWGVNVGLGFALWLMARLSRAELRGGSLILVATFFWNLGVLVGLVGILTGDSTSLKWLEMPPYSTALLFAAYVLVAVWCVLTFRVRRSEHVYVSQWYLLAALFWLPWIFSVAQVMAVFAPARGTLQSLVNAWYVHNFSGLWLTPLALAASYYLLPKILNKPVHSYYLSTLGFWWLAFFSSFAGAALVLGGPVPAWVQAAGVAATLMLLVPVVIIGINHFGTLAGNFSDVRNNISLRFVVFGIVAFTVSTLATVAFSLRSVAAVTQFTMAAVAVEQLALYGFFSMTMFGAIYFVLPRVTGKTWHSTILIRTHFAACALGILVLVVSLGVGGVKQGLDLGDPSVVFLSVVRESKAYLLGATLGSVLILAGHFAFAVGVLGFFKPSRSVAGFENSSQHQVAAQ